MANTPKNPDTLEGDDLQRWYQRSPVEIELERQAKSAEKYGDFFGGLQPAVTEVAFRGGQPARAGGAPAQLGFNMDPAFLASVEGAKAEVYLPMEPGKPGFAKSGPTVGVGVDLGSKDTAYLKSLGIEPALVKKLTPYLGRRGRDAYDFLGRNKVTLSDPEVWALNAAVHDKEFRNLAEKFDADSKVGPFRKLPRDTQTAIGSLYLQYGTSDPAGKTPNYWRQITTGDWTGAYQNLMKFGDDYGPRRKAEAGRLMNDIRSGSVPRAVVK